MANEVTHFLVRPEAVLMGFFRGFFAQERLFSNIANDFVYTDNKEKGSLIIKLSEQDRDEVINVFPAIVIQEGGFQEDIRMMDNRKWHDNFLFYEGHKGSYFHPITLHCLSETKASAKTLQAATSKSLITFRKAIYGLGVDNIGPLHGGAPQRINASSETATSLYDCTISFNMRMEQDWIFTDKGVPEEIIAIKVFDACRLLEFDANGNPTNPSEEWFQENITIQW